MRRIRADHPEFELRNALVYTARKDRPCDIHGCGATIRAGLTYALINTGVAACNRHWEPADIVDVAP